MEEEEEVKSENEEIVKDEDFEIYTVKKGDTLFGISIKFNVR